MILALGGFESLVFTVHMALVVFEVESLSKVMANIDHLSFGSLDEAIAVGQAKIFSFYKMSRMPPRGLFNSLPAISFFSKLHKI